MYIAVVVVIVIVVIVVAVAVVTVVIIADIVVVDRWMDARTDGRADGCPVGRMHYGSKQIDSETSKFQLGRE